MKELFLFKNSSCAKQEVRNTLPHRRPGCNLLTRMSSRRRPGSRLNSVWFPACAGMTQYPSFSGR